MGFGGEGTLIIKRFGWRDNCQHKEYRLLCFVSIGFILPVILANKENKNE